MSELEFLKRQRYKRNRKRLSIIQLVAIILLTAMALVSFFVYHRIDKTQLIEYTETGNVNYQVQYKENEFFPDEWLDKDKTYISSLIENMTADFTYNLNTSSDEMKFNYQYVVNAKLLIASRDKGTPYYQLEEQLSPQKSGIIKRQENLKITESVEIDYVKYNLLAKSFIDTYGLESSASCTLIVTLDVVTQCANNGFDNVNQVNYSTSLNVPLAVDSVNMFRSSGGAEGQVNNLEYAGATNRKTVLIMTVVFAALALIMLFIRTAFLLLTRNEDVTYKAKVHKIVRSYGSFIQKMFGEFDCDGYQIIQIKTFVEMLGIRDTIQSPVLMSENKDETMTRFYIPTSTKLLYVFEIKVDNYDEIYGPAPDDDGPNGGFDPNGTEPTDGGDSFEDEPIASEGVEVAPVPVVVEEKAETSAPVAEIQPEEVAEEAPTQEDEPAPIVEAEPTVDEPVQMVEAEPTVEESDEDLVPPVISVTEIIKNAPLEVPSQEELTNAIIDRLVEADEIGEENGGDEVLAYLDEEGNIVRITCSRSFTANLIQANPKVRNYYNEIKNRILSYKGVKARMSWRNETFNKGRIQLFKIKIRGKTVCLYCALDPQKYENSAITFEVATAKNYAKVPMMVKIKSDRGLSRALELIDDAMENFAIVTREDATTQDFISSQPYDTTKNLVKRGLIKILLPDAILSEPKPSHEHEKVLEVVKKDVVEEIVIFNADAVAESDIESIVYEPTPDIEKIDFVEEPTEEAPFVETEEEPGVDVIGVVWPERPERNKIYRYDPNGEEASVGDVVIVPTHDAHRNREVIRKAAVAHANHKIPKKELKHPLKKIAGVIRKKLLEGGDTKK